MQPMRADRSGDPTDGSSAPEPSRPGASSPASSASVLFSLEPTGLQRTGAHQGAVVLDLSVAKTAKQSDSSAAARRRHKNQRKRRPNGFPEPPSGIELVWAKSNPHLRDYGPAEAVVDLIERPIWEDTIASACREVDKRDARRNSKLIYPGDAIETLLFAQIAYGLKTIDGKSQSGVGLRTYLRNSDRRKDLALLGFDRSRDLPTGITALHGDGLPAGARFTQHIQRMALAGVDREAMWRRIYEYLRAAELMLIPPEELAVLYMDSSHVETIYTCPIYAKDKKGNKIYELDENGEMRQKVVNRAAVRCWDGGVLPKDSHDPYANGFKLTMAWTSSGTPLGFVSGAITQSDKVLAHPLIQEIGPLLKPRIVPHHQIGVLVLDSGFHEPYHLRDQIRSHGYLECCTSTSAANEAETEKENNVWHRFRDRPHWGTNGHREIQCECGTATITRRVKHNNHGSLAVWIEAECKKKKEFFTIRSGDYVLTETGWRDYDPNVTDEHGIPEKYKADLRVGNSLTMNDHLAIMYGQKRFAHNEGFHGALTRSELFFNGKYRFRSLAELNIATYQLLSCLHLRGIFARQRGHALAVVA